MSTITQTLTKKDYAIGYAELTLAQSCVGLNVITGKYLIGYFPILREPIHGVEIMGMLLVILAIFIGCKKEIKS